DSNPISLEHDLAVGTASAAHFAMEDLRDAGLTAVTMSRCLGKNLYGPLPTVPFVKGPKPSASASSAVSVTSSRAHASPSSHPGANDGGDGSGSVPSPDAANQPSPVPSPASPSPSPSHASSGVLQSPSFHFLVISLGFHFM
ncbi:hypothetical protein HDU91_001066, partial [Kappamyces sp. JEL0680]